MDAQHGSHTVTASRRQRRAAEVGRELISGLRPAARRCPQSARAESAQPIERPSQWLSQEATNVRNRTGRAVRM